ncbi:hypothetical protein HDV01_005048 [Terramyces sp. JEL0728]|nr:hypothetical protein HDV01_005048 [Terramyces sp. JEL0728]
MFQWTALKEHILMDAVVKYNKSWGRIATCIPGSDAKDCHERYEQLKLRGYRSPPKNITILPKPAKKRKKAMSSPIEPLKVLISNAETSEPDVGNSSVLKTTLNKSPAAKNTSPVKRKTKKSPKSRKKPKLASSPVFGLVRDSPFTSVRYPANLPPSVQPLKPDILNNSQNELLPALSEEPIRKETSLMKRFRESATPPSIPTFADVKNSSKIANVNTASPLHKYSKPVETPKLMDSTSPLLEIEASSAMVVPPTLVQKTGVDLGFDIVLGQNGLNVNRNEVMKANKQDYLESLFSDQPCPTDEVQNSQFIEDPNIPHEEFEDLFNDTLKEKTYDVLLKTNHQIDWVYDSSKCFGNNQVQELKEQMQQLFQLTLQNYVIESDRIREFLPNEDVLLYNGLINFGLQDMVSIHIHYLPAKPVNQIRQRINNVRRRSKSFNFIKDFYLLPFKPMTVNEKMLLKNGIIQYGIRFREMTSIVFPHIPWYLIVAAWDELFLIGAVKVHYDYVECIVGEPVSAPVKTPEVTEIAFDDIFEIESPEKPNISPEISPSKRVSFSQFISPIKSPTKIFSPVKYEKQISQFPPKSPIQIFKEKLNSPKKKKGRKGNPQRSTTLNQEILPAWNSDFETDYEYTDTKKSAIHTPSKTLKRTPIKTPQNASLPKISFAGMYQLSESEDEQYDRSSPIVESLLKGRGKGKLPRSRQFRKINRDRIESLLRDAVEESLPTSSDVPFLNTRSKKQKPSKCDSTEEVIKRRSATNYFLRN